VLTWHRESARRALFGDMTMRSHHDAKNARAIGIGICQYRRKCLHYSCLLDSRSMRSTRDHVRRESHQVVNRAARGL
jgi:hypothetical protein